MRVSLVRLEPERKIKIMIQLVLHTEELLNKVTEQWADFFPPRNIVINTEGHNGLIVFLLTSSEKRQAMVKTQ